MYKKIMVPLDGSKLAECVLPHVETVVKGCGVETVIFIRVDEPVQVTMGDDGYAFSAEDWKRMEAGSRAAAEQYLNQVMSKVKYDGIKVKSEVLASGLAADMIAEYASKGKIDLIIIATHGRSGLSRWVLGSVADRVMRASCVPVLMLRAPGCTPSI